MGKVEDKATEQARRHASEFFEEHDWDDILEKYAEVSNRSREELDRIIQRTERGARVEEADTADYHYYQCYYDLFAHWIANSELSSKGYERDKHKNWILKKQSPTPPKKKFGFW